MISIPFKSRTELILHSKLEILHLGFDFSIRRSFGTVLIFSLGVATLKIGKVVGGLEQRYSELRQQGAK